MALVGDVVDPGEGRRGGRALGDILIRHDHHRAPFQLLRQRQAGMRRMRERPALHAFGDQLRPRNIADVEDEDAVVPVAHVKPVAQAQRMVAARLGVFGPRILLAARGPLAGNPPAADFHWARGILQVQDHADVADVALDRRRDVGVAPVERVAVHAFAGRLPLGKLLRLRRIGDVVDAEAAAELRAALPEALVVDDHHAVRDAHLVRMPALGHRHGGEELRMARIRNIQDRGAIRVVHVADVERVAVDPDLAAARDVDMGDERRI